jgi:multidrug resistance protein, MATE family
LFELKTIARHAGTVLVGQLAVMAFGVTDTLVAGRYSESALATLSVGSAIYISVYVALMGILQALLPVWAELHGGRQFQALGRSVRQALYLCGLTAVAGIIALLYPDAVMRWTQVPEALQGEVKRYLAVLALALPPSLLFRMYSTLNQALGKPALVTWLQAGSLFLKVPLSVWFAFGGLGLEPQGAVGCAWATLIVNYAMLGLAIWMLRTQDLYRPYHLWRSLERPDWKQIGAFARLGIPGGLAIMVEVTSFTLMALFIARLGTVASASHQVATSLAAVLYMVPLSLAIATSSRASFWLGAAAHQKARSAIITGLKLTATAALALAGLLWFARHGLAGAYANNPAVISLAATLLAWVALFHLFDSVQAVCVFILRCYRVTVAPLLVYCVLLWGVGLGGGYMLAYEGLPNLGAIPTPVTFWAASTAALALTALVFTLFLWRAMHQPNAAHPPP